MRKYGASTTKVYAVFQIVPSWAMAVALCYVFDGAGIGKFPPMPDGFIGVTLATPRSSVTTQAQDRHAFYTSLLYCTVPLCFIIRNTLVYSGAYEIFL